MSRVEISQKSIELAQKSLKHMYLNKFGEDSLSDSQQSFGKDELILRYSSNLRFWSDNLPDVRPDMNQFTLAKHAICSNAIERLWEKADEYNIRYEIEIVVNHT